MKTAPKASVKFATEYLNLTEEEGYNWGMMRAAWSSVAEMAIVPMQDLIGLGSEAAVIGMMFHTVSFLTKAFSEAFEEVDQGSLEALKATGATWWQQIARGVFPDKLNEILSWIFIRFENNFVGAVTVGAIAGSGGIGYYLYIVANYMFNWHEMGLIIYLCLAVSVTLEIIATQLRKRFIVHR